jgi:hypothetical protein
MVYQAPAPAPLATPAAYVEIALEDVKLDRVRAERARRIGARAQAAIAPVLLARRALVDVLATSLETNDERRGAIEDATLRLLRATEAAAPELAQAMGDLHALLTPSERRVLVDRARVEWPRWEQRWRLLAHDDDVAIAGPAGGVSTLAARVGLRPDQHQYVARELRRRRVLHASEDRDVVFARFADADFDARELSSYWIGLSMRSAQRARIVVETMFPLLDRDQRQALANLLRPP